MALKIRLQRSGKKKFPFYRIVVSESTSPRDGRFVEILGTYNPQAKGETPRITLDLDRLDYRIKTGAKPTETVANLVKLAKKGQTEEATKVTIPSKAKAAA